MLSCGGHGTHAIGFHEGFAQACSVLERGSVKVDTAGISPPPTDACMLPAMTTIRMEKLAKRYGNVEAVRGIDLTIESGELFFLLGPSGCGKTTLLRMLAGFLEPTGGRLFFDDRDVTQLPANKRQAGMVFQSYALWPHMSVKQNVGYGLDIRKVSGADKERRVNTALETVQMGHLGDRRPNELSGGQQQRVALARALVVEPSVVLLDEPLSNLDARLRQSMRSEIRRICKEHGLTGVYVTHDQEEALSMADRIALLREGQIQQSGTPEMLYSRPNTRFTAEFLGETNLVDATIHAAKGNGVELDTPLGRLSSTALPTDLPEAGNVTCSIRPESLRLIDQETSHSPAAAIVTGQVQERMFLGERCRLTISCGDAATPLHVLEIGAEAEKTRQNANVRMAIEPEDVVVLSD